LQAPPGIYFSGDFTVIYWFKYRTVGHPYPTLVDFGNGSPMDNVILGFAVSNSSLYFEVDKKTNYSEVSGSSVGLNSWNHMAFVLRGTNGLIFLNGVLVANGNLFVPNAVIRTSNFIGRSNWVSSYIDGDLSDLKIYKGALTAKKILNDYVVSSMNG